MPSALASLPQLVAQSLESRFLLKRWCDILALSLHLHFLFAACLSVPQVSEAIAHREQIILFPNIGVRKRLLLRCHEDASAAAAAAAAPSQRSQHLARDADVAVCSHSHPLRPCRQVKKSILRYTLNPSKTIKTQTLPQPEL